MHRIIPSVDWGIQEPMKKWFVAIFTAAALGLFILVSAINPLHSSANVTSPDEAVAAFTNAMGTEDYTVLLNGLESVPGTDPAGGARNALPLESAEQQGVVGGRTISRAAHSDLLSRERAFVLSQFGTTAWSSVTYRLVKMPSAEKMAKWVTRAGKAVDEAQAQAMLQSFWDGVSRREGVDLSVLSKPSTPESMGVSKETWQAMVSQAGQIRERFAGEAPVQMQLVDRYEAYDAVFAFNGTEVAPSGGKDFRITLSNASGSWTIQGLQWEPSPPAEPSGDI